MPGLNQLKKFSEDVLNLGNELSVRSERGESPVTVPLPFDVPEDDDSEDFVLGLPESDAVGGDSESDEASGIAEPTDADLSDQFGSEIPSGMAGTSVDMSAFPELDSILNPVPEDPDLSEFTGETVGPDLTSDAAIPPADIEELQELSDADVSSDEPFRAESEEAAADFSFPDIPMDDLFDSPINNALPAGDSPGGSAPDGIPGEEPIFDDFAESGPEISLSEDFSEPGVFDGDAAFSGDASDAADDSAADGTALDGTDDSSDGDGSPLPSGDGDAFSAESDGGPADFSMPEIPDFDLASFDGDAAFSGGASDAADGTALDGAESGDPFGSPQFDIAADSVPDPFATPEVFDIPDDPFTGGAPIADDADDGSGFSAESDDDPFGDFDIPGFSDRTAGTAPIKATPKLQGAESRREKNTLTDTEYKTFLKNLSSYPLNIRLALEEFIVNNEFTDDAVFEVVEKVLKKASARQVATHLEKLMDISLSVPRDFERRTFDQYEEYKKSVEYQLKNRIVPGILLCAMAGIVVFLLFLFGKFAVYNPLKAESLYRQGYALLESNEYPQSELKFNEAVSYQPKKKWFFTYARGYRAHRQYERARSLYKAVLMRFKQDKQAGLEYAQMELDDLRNFENAETIVRREVLDYHINDKDGLLLLGDIFLEWGDERDPAKYDEAFEIYTDLAQLYGQKDIYLSRLLRYFIRVDDLRNVLQLKTHFYPKKKSLGARDLTELSGYLLDKLYGELPASDEYLRSSIEDVRDLLERAVAAGADIPESKYNLARYFIKTGNRSAAKLWMQESLDAFDAASVRPRKRLNRHVNAYRLLGELYAEDKEYLTAEDLFRSGIRLYEKEHAAGLIGDANTGMLYADTADLDYFISGDFDEALKNYLSAVRTQYDTPSVRYKIGYIQYSKKNYAEALGSFIKASEQSSSDLHVLLALGNVLSLRGNNFAAQGYYEKLLQLLDSERSRYGIMFPQVNTEHADIVDLYLKASNNLGVTQYRLAQQTGDSALNAQAMVNLTTSLRAWDALTRNQETMIRLGGTNLAERNVTYMSHPVPDYEPSIYTELPRVLTGESFPE